MIGYIFFSRDIATIIMSGFSRLSLPHYTNAVSIDRSVYDSITSESLTNVDLRSFEDREPELFEQALSLGVIEAGGQDTAGTFASP